MEPYIKKSALVAEIKRLLSAFENSDAPIDRLRASILIGLLSFINTLEVKEVDLNEEIEKCLKRHSMLAVGKKDFIDIAKHFFELGLSVSNKTQKGE